MTQKITLLNANIYNLNRMKSIDRRSRQYSSGKHSESMDMDPLSTSIIQQLINSESEWRNENQIIKLTFTAISDLLQAHSQTIKDFKSIITTRSSKQQLSTGLSLKANASDIARMVEQISSAVDSKVSYSDINSILKEYAHKKDLNELTMLAQSQTKDKGYTSKRKQEQVELQIKIIQARIDDFQKQISRRLGGCVTLSEFQQLISIVEQKVNISEMNQVLENRVSKQYLTTCLQKKVSKSDLQIIMSNKAQASDLDFIVNSLEMKASLPTIEKLTQIIENKADRSDLLLIANQKKIFNEEISDRVQITKNQLQTKFNDIRRQIQNTKTMLSEGLKLANRQNQNMLRNYTTNSQLNLVMNQQKKDCNQEFAMVKSKMVELEREASNQLKYQSFKRQLTNQINLRKRCEEKIYEQIDDVRRRAQQVANKALDKIQFFNFKSEIGEQIDQKIETQHVQEAFNKWEVELSQKMQEDKQQIYSLIQRIQKTLSESISSNSQDILNLINNYSSNVRNTNSNSKSMKYDQSGVEELIRKNRREIQQCRKTVDQSYSQLRGKIDIAQYETDLLELRKKFDIIERQVSLKANIKDVCILSDSKPNIQDVNKALKEIKGVLDSKTSEEDLQDVVKDQSTINQTLLCQNIIGRWLWESGQVKPGGLVPWEIQFANTMPDYYFWEKDKTSILILVTGFYHITVCVFGRAAPNLFVNGQNIHNKNDENINLGNLPLTNTKKGNTKRRKQKDIVGNKISQYISLPARSRISVSVPYEGCQGFLDIRRL